MSKVLIRNGTVIDPANNRQGRLDVLIEHGRIKAIEPSIAPNGARILEAQGCSVVPGLVDLHAHLREPGREDQETIETGARAAIHGGFTTVCAMPNTDPPIDSAGVAQFVREAAQRAGQARVHPIGAITKDRRGEALSDFSELFEAGCVALSDDGHTLTDSLLMRRALEYAKVFGRPIIQHAEDPQLACGGVMHEGLVSTTLGLLGIPAEAESVVVARDLALAELTGGWLHAAHLSSAQSVALIRLAKQRGVRVSCEVTPHHLALTDEAVGEFDTGAKVNPPLRSEADRQALIEGLRDGTIDCIATDHAPHTEWEKDDAFDTAPFGISGLETALSVCAQVLVAPGLMGWAQLIEKLAPAPARIAGLDAGTLGVGREADVTVIDPHATWTVEPQAFVSKGRRSPFAGRTLPCRVVAVLRKGQLVFESGRLAGGAT